ARSPGARVGRAAVRAGLSMRFETTRDGHYGETDTPRDGRKSRSAGVTTTCFARARSSGRVPTGRSWSQEERHAVHDHRALPGPRHAADLQASPGRRPDAPGGPDLPGQLGRAELQPVLPADGVQRSPAPPGMGAQVAG